MNDIINTMNILITAPYNESGRERLIDSFGNVIYKPWKEHGRGYNEEELIQLLRETSADALITEHDRVTENVINSRPNLRFIGVCRGTPSNVSVDTARQHNIPVFNTPGRNAQAVAEMFISNVIWLMRKTTEAVNWLESGQWDEGAHTSYLQFKGNELAGKTIGMVGFGAVGRRIAGMLRHFPCRIQFYDPFVEESFPDYEQVTLKELFSTSDVISVHLPVNEQTKGMIDHELFKLMKPDAIFVNTARASVIKREDLLDVLKNQKIRGAVLDVFDNEPPDEVDYELIRLPNVLATPHIAGATHEVEDHHVEILNSKLIEHFFGNHSE
jgi:D-3-phosphoglycerate dehydrogenase